MSWRAYEVLLRLRSPVHIGSGRVGNLQRTRPYVPGRTLWGALTARLVRDGTAPGESACDSNKYRETGAVVNEKLAFSYFYPAIRDSNGIRIIWPWSEESDRLSASYGSTALKYTNQSAEEGTLHEAEFITPNAWDGGAAIFLVGYVFEAEGAPDWKRAIDRVQLGGERGYGWGRVEFQPGSGPKPLISKELFNGATAIESLTNTSPLLRLSPGEIGSGRLLAHTHFKDSGLEGPVEPLVGREWRSDQAFNRYAGQHVEYLDVFLTPGTEIMSPACFEVGDWGLWIRKRARHLPLPG